MSTQRYAEVVDVLETVRRWLRRDDTAVDDPHAEADARRMAYDRDSIRVSQNLPGRPLAPTPDELHPGERDR